MIYPQSNYHFTVEWGGNRIGFTEVSGLDIFFEVIETRDGSSPDSGVIKMPGRVSYSNIILKRTIIAGDNDFIKWINTIYMNKVEKRDLVISLLNEEHNPVVSWKVRNSFPVKYSGPVLNALGNEVAIETLEIAHEGLSLSIST